MNKGLPAALIQSSAIIGRMSYDRVYSEIGDEEFSLDEYVSDGYEAIVVWHNIRILLLACLLIISQCHIYLLSLLSVLTPGPILNNYNLYNICYSLS